MSSTSYPSSSTTLPRPDLIILGLIGLEIVAEIFNSTTWRFLLKLLPMFGLIYVAVDETNRRRLRNGKYLVTLLIFSTLGDFFLLFKSNTLFLSGLVSFLVAHLINIYLMWANQKPVRWAQKDTLNIRIAIALLWVLTLLNFVMLWHKFPHKTLCTIYGVVLTLMITCAILRYKATTRESYWLVIFGVVLFGISDNLLAFLKFNDISSDIGRVLVMVTYYGSQYLITYGNLLPLSQPSLVGQLCPKIWAVGSK